MVTKLTQSLGYLMHFPVYVGGGIFYKLSGFLFTPRPKFVCFPVTFRCNSRCQMCNLWKNPDTIEELDLKKIGKIFSNRLFKKVNEVVLHGGEPTLRKDLKDIYKIIINSCPKLTNITSSTNGLNPNLVNKRMVEILSTVNSNKVKLTFTVSIDGLKAAHEKIRGREGGFDRAIETLKVMKKHQEKHPLEIKIITVIQPQNVQDLEGMEKLAKDNEVDIIFQPLMIDSFYHNSSTDPRLQFSEDQVQQYQEFIDTKFKHNNTTTSYYWKTFFKIMAGGKRIIPCAYDRYVLSLYPTGEVLPCSKEDWILFGNVHEKSVDEIWYSKESKKMRQKIRKEVCPTCTFYCSAEYSLEKEFFTYFRYYMKRALSSLVGISKA